MTDQEVDCGGYASDTSMVSNTTHGTHDPNSPLAFFSLKRLMKVTPKKRCEDDVFDPVCVSPVIPSQNIKHIINFTEKDENSITNLCCSDSVCSESILHVDNQLPSLSKLSEVDGIENTKKSPTSIKGEKYQRCYNHTQILDDLFHSDNELNAESVKEKSVTMVTSVAEPLPGLDVEDDICSTASTRIGSAIYSGTGETPKNTSFQNEKDLEAENHHVKGENSQGNSKSFKNCTDDSVSTQPDSNPLFYQIEDTFTRSGPDNDSRSHGSTQVGKCSSGSSEPMDVNGMRKNVLEPSPDSLTPKLTDGEYTIDDENGAKEIVSSNDHVDSCQTRPIGDRIPKNVGHNGSGAKIKDPEFDSSVDEKLQPADSGLSSQLLDFIVEFSQVSTMLSSRDHCSAIPAEIAASKSSKCDPNTDIKFSMTKNAGDKNDDKKNLLNSQRKSCDSKHENDEASKIQIPSKLQIGPQSNSDDKRDSESVCSFRTNRSLRSRRSIEGHWQIGSSSKLKQKETAPESKQQKNKQAQTCESSRENNTITSFKLRYTDMGRIIRQGPDTSCLLDLQAELKEFQGKISHINNQHKAERAKMSVLVQRKGLTKPEKKQLKGQLQELGERQKHLVDLVQRHKEVSRKVKDSLEVMQEANVSKDTNKVKDITEKTSLKSGNIEVKNDLKIDLSPSGHHKKRTGLVNSDLDNACKSHIPKRTTEPSPVESIVAPKEAKLADQTSHDKALSFKELHEPMKQKSHKEALTLQITPEAVSLKSIKKNHDDFQECIAPMKTVSHQKSHEKTMTSQVTPEPEKNVSTESNQNSHEKALTLQEQHEPLSLESQMCHKKALTLRVTPELVQTASLESTDVPATQTSVMEDTQKDLFSQGSSRSELIDKNVLENIIQTQTSGGDSAMATCSEVPEMTMETAGEVITESSISFDKIAFRNTTQTHQDKESETHEVKKDYWKENIKKPTNTFPEIIPDHGKRLGADIPSKLNKFNQRSTELDEDCYISKKISVKPNCAIVKRKLPDHENVCVKKPRQEHVETNNEVSGVVVSSQAIKSKKFKPPITKVILPTTTGAEHASTYGAKTMAVQTRKQGDFHPGILYKPLEPKMAASKIITVCTVASMSQKIQQKTKDSDVICLGDEKKIAEVKTTPRTVSLLPNAPTAKLDHIDPDSLILDDANVRKVVQNLKDFSKTPINLTDKQKPVIITKTESQTDRNLPLEKTTFDAKVQTSDSTDHVPKAVDRFASHDTPLTNKRTFTSPRQNPAFKSPPEKVPSYNFLSPTSTTASSGIFPMSSRELARRAEMRHARENMTNQNTQNQQSDKTLVPYQTIQNQQSAKTFVPNQNTKIQQSEKTYIANQKIDKNPSLGQSVPGKGYIAIPVCRLEDLDKTKTTHNGGASGYLASFAQQSTRPPAQTSTVTKQPPGHIIPSVTELVKAGVLLPGKDVITLRAKDRTFRGSLDERGHIIGAGGEIFRFPTSWYKAITGIVGAKKQHAYRNVMYKGKPLSSFKLPEATVGNNSRSINTSQKHMEHFFSSSLTSERNVPHTQASNESMIGQECTRECMDSFHEVHGSAMKGQGLVGQGSTLVIGQKSSGCQSSNVNSEMSLKEGQGECGMSELKKVLQKCSIKLIDDAEIMLCPEIDRKFWVTEFKDIRMSESLWESVDSWD